LTKPKFNVEGSSRGIDRAVRTLVREALSVYRVDVDLLQRLKPTHIVTQSQCEVCAVSLRDVEEAVCGLTGSEAAVISLEPNCLEDVWDDIRRVAEALGSPQRAEKLLVRLQGRVQAIAERAEALGDRPSVACIEWIDPLMAAGNWVPELVEMAGGENLFGEAGEHSPWMEWEELVSRDPDIILLTPCGFGIERTLQEVPVLTAMDGWKDLRAVRERQVFVADGNQYFNRPCPRLVESLEILAEIIHPEAFHLGHAGKGWVSIR
jgi:iron complex transport system substrate-binding protein